MAVHLFEPAPSPLDTARQGAPPPAAARRRLDVPVLAFRAVAFIIAAFVLAGPGGVRDLLAPFTLALLGPTAELHRWHHIDVAAFLSVLTIGSLVVAAWSPRRAGLAIQAVLVSLAALAVMALTMPTPAEVIIPVTVIAVLVLAAAPQRRAVLRRPVLRPRSRLAVAAAALPTPFLLLNLSQNVGRQLAGGDPHAQLGHWAGAAALALALLLLAWLATTSAPGSQGLTVVVAATMLLLGGAALFYGRHDGAWPLWGAGSAIASAALLIASLAWRSPGKRSAAPSVDVPSTSAA